MEKNTTEYIKSGNVENGMDWVEKNTVLTENCINQHKILYVVSAKGFQVISCMKIKYSVNFISSSIELNVKMKFTRIFFIPLFRQDSLHSKCDAFLVKKRKKKIVPTGVSQY